MASSFVFAFRSDFYNVHTEVADALIVQLGKKKLF